MVKTSAVCPPPAPGPIVALDAYELSEAIRRRKLSCREVIAAYYDRIELLNPIYNAIVALQPRAQMLAQADERDRQLARGEYLGWMHGLPQAIKDLTPVQGMATTSGSPLLANEVGKRDGLFVERMRAAGALFIGKTNTPEFGLGSHTFNPVYGITRNAWDPSKTAGGSSGGAAVALATHMLPVADGSDMGGSLRNPAAFNNVYGFRPSFGRVPNLSNPELFYQQLGNEGPMGRTVRDLTRLMATMSGHDPRSPLALDGDGSEFAHLQARKRWQGTRVGWLADWGGYLPMENGILELCESNGLRHLSSLGCEVVPLELGFPPLEIWQSFMRLRQCLVGGKLYELYRDPLKRAMLKPEAAWEAENGLAGTAVDVYQASVTRSRWYLHVLELFKQVDFLVTPTAQVFPFDAQQRWPQTVAGRTMDTYHRWMEVVVPWTMAGLPVLNVPVGFNSAGLPMGMQLIGPPRADPQVLQLGHAYEQANESKQKRSA